ncbi:MAG: hypothetical protein Q7T89_01570, partial [Anaerolineales bacterium]|nr:hypothetical protein [Anaerolineales bacterium]
MSKLNKKNKVWKFFWQVVFIFIFISATLGFSPNIAVEARGDSSAPVASEEAAPLFAPPLATVTLGVPASVQIGQAFSFTATFDNTDTTAPGYGPFIDLYFPVTGVDGAGAAIDDGVDFTSATFLGAPVTAVSNTFGAAGTGGCIAPLGPVTHPYAVLFPSGAAHVVCGTPGDKLVTLQLPFGYFAPDQPAAVVTVNATLSNLADANTALNIRARGGYQFGATPTNDWCCLEGSIVRPPGTATVWPASPLTPVLLSLTKSYIGPEDETASGPNYPRQYTLTVDIAAGQQVTSLIVTDTLPSNMQYVSVASSSPAATCTTVPAPLTTPGGALTCNFGTVTGGAGASDATVTFNFYIPLNNSGATAVINAVSGDDATSLNTSSVTGSWDPIDIRDPLTPVTAGGVCPTGCHTLTDKSIAIQKSVSNTTDASNSPGDILEYRLEFQVSDFFSFQNVFLTDVISDGQRITGTPTLQVDGNNYALISAAMNAANYTVDNSQIGNSGPGLDGTDGSQTIIFRISDEIITRGNTGGLIGGCIPVAGTGGPVPNCGTYNNGATTGVIVFRAVIQDQFTDTYPSGDPSVDHGDILTNNVTVTGALLSVTNNSTVTGQSEADTSSTSVSIAFGSLAKTVYAVNGITCEPCATEISTDGVSPGDTLTFRLRYVQPSSDFEQTVLTDYLPLPIFDATDVTTFTNLVSGTPASGFANLGPADTYHSLPGAVIPSMVTNATNNTVSFTYGAYDSPTNTTSEIDLLFTVTLSAEPFADGLFLTNQANSAEGTTNAGDQTLNTILQIKINEPVLIPKKSAVSTNSTAGGITFTPPIGAPIIFDVPGVVDGTADWSGGAISSTYLAANAINADLTGIDGGDL